MLALLVRNWGWIALRGVVAIVFGVLALLYPALTLVTLVYLFGAYAIADGLFMLVSGVANRKTAPRWGALVFGGVVGIAIGLLTYVWPGITAVALLAMIAMWAVFMGIIEVTVAIRLRKELTGEWSLILAGLLAVAFGALIGVNPAAGALAVILWIGSFALVTGVLLVVLALRLRNWGRAHGMVAAA